MKFNILGKYGPFSVNGGGTSSYLVQSNNNAILLDLGSSCVSKALKLIDVNNLTCIIISHTHFDHVSDIGVLTYALDFLRKKLPINLYIPNDGSDVYNFIKANKNFNVIDVCEGKIFKEGEFEFEFYKMEHPVLCYGVTIKKGDKVLGYTGDSKLTKNVENIAKKSTVLIADGAFLEKDFNQNKPHMSAKQVAEIAKKYKVKTIISHIGYNYLDEEVENEVNEYSEFVFVAKEGKCYNL